MKLNIKTLCAVGALAFASTAVFGMNGALEESRRMSWSELSQLVKYELMSWSKMSEIVPDRFSREVIYASDIDIFLEKRSDICNKFYDLFVKGTNLLVDEIHRQRDAYGSIDALLEEHFDDWYSYWNPIIRTYNEELKLIDLLRESNFASFSFYSSGTILKQLDAHRKLEGDPSVVINKLNNKMNILIRDLEASHSRMHANESIESAVQMFEEAEREATADESIESAVQMFEEAESKAAEFASRSVVSGSSYSKFGQFFESIWSRFAESRLGRTLRFVKSYFFGIN